MLIAVQLRDLLPDRPDVARSDRPVGALRALPKRSGLPPTDGAGRNRQAYRAEVWGTSPRQPEMRCRHVNSACQTRSRPGPGPLDWDTPPLDERRCGAALAGGAAADEDPGPTVPLRLANSEPAALAPVDPGEPQRARCEASRRHRDCALAAERTRVARRQRRPLRAWPAVILVLLGDQRRADRRRATKSCATCRRPPRSIRPSACRSICAGSKFEDVNHQKETPRRRADAGGRRHHRQPAREAGRGAAPALRACATSRPEIYTWTALPLAACSPPARRSVPQPAGLAAARGPRRAGALLHPRDLVADINEAPWPAS